MTIEKISDEELNAYLDGELPDARRGAVEAYLREHPEGARRLEDYRADGETICRFFSVIGSTIPATSKASTAAWRALRTDARRWAAAAVLILAVGVAAGWFGRGRMDDGGMERFARQAAAAHLVLTGPGARPVAVAPLDDLARAISIALGVQVALHDPGSTGYHIVSARVVPQMTGSAVQLALRGPADDIITLYFEGRPGAKETAIRQIRGGGVTTLVREDDNLVCAITGALDPKTLEDVGRRIYAKLLG